jgi:hypothetical protein
LSSRSLPPPTPADPTLVGAAALVGLAVLGMLSSCPDVRHLGHRLPSAPRDAVEQLPA